MSRVLRLAPRYLRGAVRVGAAPGTPAGHAVGRTIVAMLKADALGVSDTVAMIPPTGTAFVRRVHLHNLWLWYRFTPWELIIVTITTEPPVPID